MTVTIKNIIDALEAEVNPGLQESWDNTGWQVRPLDLDVECSGVMVCVDVTDAVISEAESTGCNLIVSHHPLIFRSLKKLTGDTPVERKVIRLIQSRIAVYSAHTSLDSVEGGVSWYLAEALGLTGIRPLAPRKDDLYKMAVYVPANEVEKVAEAMYKAGAGHIGNYDHCRFVLKGEGAFRPLAGSDPYIGNQGSDTKVEEVKLEMVVPAYKRHSIEKAARKAHPYEEPAIDVYKIEGADLTTGLGAVGDLSPGLTPDGLIARVKEEYGSPTVRTTPTDEPSVINRVALCGGSGGEFIPLAIAAGAQAYVTSDVRYHDFVDYRDKILIIDTGHFESEKCTTVILSRIISKKFPNFAVRIASSETNSINYR